MTREHSEIINVRVTPELAAAVRETISRRPQDTVSEIVRRTLAAYVRRHAGDRRQTKRRK